MKQYDEYKDSGVEWLGMVPGHWSLVRHKDNYALLNERSTNANALKIALENIEGFTGRYLPSDTEFEGEGIAFKKGDILFGKLRPYLAKVLLADFDGSAVGDIFTYRPNKNISPLFSQYLMLSDRYLDVINSSTAGAKMPRVSSQFIANLPVATPSLEEQTKIVSYLDTKTATIDTKIDLLQKKADTYRALRQSLINESVTRGLDKSAPRKDSGVQWIGEIPSHWEVKRLKEVGTLVLGKMLDNIPSPGKYLKPYLKSKNIGWFQTDLTSVEEMYFSDYELRLYRIKYGDLLFSEGGEVGKTSFWTNGIPECYLQNSVHKLSVFKENLSKYYLYLSCAAGLQGYYDTIVNFVSIKHLTKEKLQRVVWVRPPLGEQLQIADYLDEKTAQINQIVASIGKQIDTLKEFRKTLINDVVTGKIKVVD